MHRCCERRLGPVPALPLPLHLPLPRRYLRTPACASRALLRRHRPSLGESGDFSEELKPSKQLRHRLAKLVLAQRGPRELSPVKCRRAGLAAAQGGSAAAQPPTQGSFVWRAGREPAAALGLPAGLGIPHAAATFANVSKYHEVVRGGELPSFYLQDACLHLKLQTLSAVVLEEPLCMGIRLEKAIPPVPVQELRPSCTPSPPPLSSHPFVPLNLFCFAVHSYLHSSPPPPCLSNFTLPSYLERLN